MFQTTLVRFARRLGFEGYQEFRRQFQLEEIHHASPAERFRSLATENNRGSAAEQAALEMENLQLCLDKLDEAQMERLINKMISARKVYTCGGSISSFAAEIMAFRMNSLGFPFEYLELGRLPMPEKLLYAQCGDLLIIFDFPDYVSQLEEGVLYAKKQGLEIALMTDHITCPLIKYADLVFYCAAQTDLFKNSLTAPVFLMNVLMSLAIYRDNSKMMAYLQKREQARQPQTDNTEGRCEP